jgi:hypothetical protein
MVREYGIYGLRVCSELELDAAPSPAAWREVQLALTEHRAPVERAPRGEMLAEHADRERGFWIVRTEAGYALGVRGVLEASISENFDCIQLVGAPEASPDLLRTFAQGAALATLLTLSEACVLHASAVEISGRAVAFAGASGSGKSTLAALCCAAGARLLTDDLLVVRDPGARPCGLRGTTHLRLRPTSGEIVNLFPSVPRLTADERWSVAVPASSAELDLAAILLPERPVSHRPELTRLRASQAAVALTRCPRIPGWRDQRVLASEFRYAAALARNVPAFSIRIPWQNRSPDAVLNLVLDSLGKSSAGQDRSEVKPA